MVVGGVWCSSGSGGSATGLPLEFTGCGSERLGTAGAGIGQGIGTGAEGMLSNGGLPTI
jgi:hypothetical protein